MGATVAKMKNSQKSCPMSMRSSLMIRGAILARERPYCLHPDPRSTGPLSQMLPCFVLLGRAPDRLQGVFAQESSKPRRILAHYACMLSSLLPAQRDVASGRNLPTPRDQTADHTGCADE